MIDPEERKRLAEEWRVAGEILRKKSPALFAKMLETLAALVCNDDDEGDRQENISQTSATC